MVDTCVITREAGHVTDPDTGQTTVQTATVYTGKCRVRQAASIARPDVVGEAHLLQQPLQLHLPVSSSVGVLSGDQAQITASVDADLIGRRFWVRQLAHQTDSTARRLGLEEVT